MSSQWKIKNRRYNCYHHYLVKQTAKRLLKKGIIRVVGERDGKPVYGLTEAGERRADQNAAQTTALVRAAAEKIRGMGLKFCKLF